MGTGRNERTDRDERTARRSRAASSRSRPRSDTSGDGSSAPQSSSSSAIAIAFSIAEAHGPGLTRNGPLHDRRTVGGSREGVNPLGSRHGPLRSKRAASISPERSRARFLPVTRHRACHPQAHNTRGGVLDRRLCRFNTKSAHVCCGLCKPCTARTAAATASAGSSSSPARKCVNTG
eukprot:Amastigsp_a1789_7.p4 type:complete len:177 gc:universal Amastigsp_a1789_7:1484-954(-)